jgi:hypothetical protein
MDAFAIFNIVTAVVALASAVANVTKTDADNKVIANVSKFINVLALNFFNTKK